MRARLIQLRPHSFSRPCMPYKFQAMQRRSGGPAYLAAFAMLGLLVANRPALALGDECLVASGNNLILQMSPECKAQLLTPSGKQGFAARMDAHAQRVEADKASAAASRSAASNLKRLGQIASGDGDAAARKSAGYANRASGSAGPGQSGPAVSASPGISAYSSPAR